MTRTPQRAARPTRRSHPATNHTTVGPEHPPAPALHDHVFPEAGRELFEAVMEKIRWHHEEIGMSLGAANSDLKDRLREIANDARDMWALAELLCQAAETAG